MDKIIGYYRFFTYDKNDENSGRMYYEIETQMLYKYLVDNNVLKRNQNVLEAYTPLNILIGTKKSFQS